MSRVVRVLAPPAEAVARSVFGLGAWASTAAGVWLLAGPAWALLASVPFLLALDHRMPGPAPTAPPVPVPASAADDPGVY